MRQLNVLLLCQYDPYNAAMVVEHINAIYSLSRHRVYVVGDFVSRGGVLPESIELSEFDVLVFHYSISIALDSYIPPKTRFQFKFFSGLKVAFIQDEYRFVNRTVAAIRDLGVKVLYTCVPEAQMEKVYPSSQLPDVKKINVLTGYNSGWLSYYEPKALDDRPIDVGYRGRVYPAWHGRSGREKWEIADAFSKHPLVRRKRLKLNIKYDESSRLYGSEWKDFIMNCRAMLGVESGCSVFDFEGAISAAVDTFTSITKFDIRDLEQYERVRSKFFADVEDLIPLNQISPRCLEAIGLRTLLILYEGEYSGVLQPWRHYIPLKKDLSNMEEVVVALQDDDRVAEIISLAYAEVAQSEKLSYKSFIDGFDKAIEENCPNGLPKEELTDFYKKIPFYYIANPHSLSKNSAERLSKKFLRRLWHSMPAHLRQRITGIVR